VSAAIGLADALTNEHQEIDAQIAAFAHALSEDRVVDVGALSRTFVALRRHIYLEEELLFPPIRRAGLLMPILVMNKEHGEIWRLMDAVEDRLRSPAMDADALRSLCRELMARLDQHNAKEEPIVYPHTAIDLTTAEAAGVAEFLDAGRMPADWICEHGR
jgi:iron-sulfur cluster repair protein YtfE (RIC family)